MKGNDFLACYVLDLSSIPEIKDVVLYLPVPDPVKLMLSIST